MHTDALYLPEHNPAGYHLDGIPSDLAIEEPQFGDWKCACCKKIQERRCKQVWVPGGISSTEIKKDLKSNIELCTFFEAWCLDCIRTIYPANDNGMREEDKAYYMKFFFLIALIYAVMTINYFLK